MSYYVDPSQADLHSMAKNALRISNTAYDEEIAMSIAAAKAELLMAGVSPTAVETPDEMVKLAIVVYCKSTFGLDNPDSEKFMNSFRSLQTSLSLSSEYGATQ